MRFSEANVRTMGRTAAGVRGIKMPETDNVLSLIVVDDGDILTATRNGYGKRTHAEDYPAKGRGGQGVIDIKTTERNGPVIGAVQVREDDEIMLISDGGTLVRTAVSGISTLGRNTQGVTLIRLSEGENLVELAAIDEEAVSQGDGVEADDDSGSEESSTDNQAPNTAAVDDDNGAASAGDDDANEAGSDGAAPESGDDPE